MPTRSVGPLPSCTCWSRHGPGAGFYRRSLARQFPCSVKWKLVSPVEAESQALQPEVGITESEGGRGSSS